MTVSGRSRSLKTTAAIAASSALALIGGLLIPPPAANAATMPEVQVKATRLYTGTEHSNSNRCFLRSDNGYSPADDSPEDNYVCTNDTVGYDIQYSLKSNDQPGDFTIVYMFEGIGAPPAGTINRQGENASIANHAQLCANQPRIYSASLAKATIGGVDYAACHVRNVTPNVNASMKLTMTLNSGMEVGDYGPLKVLVIDGHPTSIAVPPAPNAEAAGFSTIGRLQVDPQIWTSVETAASTGGFSTQQVDGVDYVTLPARIYAQRVAHYGNSPTKGALQLAPDQFVQIDTSAFPPGSRLFVEPGLGRDPREIVGGRIPLEVLPPASGDPIATRSQPAASFRLYIPQEWLPPITENKSFEWPFRILQTSPTLKSVGGQENFDGEQLQPGQESANCAVGSTRTKPYPGYRGYGGHANNDCGTFQLKFWMPTGDLSGCQPVISFAKP